MNVMNHSKHGVQIGVGVHEALLNSGHSCRAQCVVSNWFYAEVVKGEATRPHRYLAEVLSRIVSEVFGVRQKKLSRFAHDEHVKRFGKIIIVRFIQNLGSILKELHEEIGLEHRKKKQIFWQILQILQSKCYLDSIEVADDFANICIVRQQRENAVA